MNAAVAVKTRLAPLALLNRCRAIENQLGRRRILHWGPRSLDLDLLLYGNARLDTPALKLPHPRIGERDFVLAPLIGLGIPPLNSLAPQGWKILLDRIPAAERTIIHSEPWR
jgi:2-amino-4-hydroxy-6-hydroxymethyldihydropteridine diphosphokinase